MPALAWPAVLESSRMLREKGVAMWRFGIPALVVLAILPVAACSIAAFILPETVPLHIGIDGTVDRWGSKWELLIVLIVASVFCNALCAVCYVFAPQLRSMGLLSAPKDNDVGIARWMLLGMAVFVDVVFIGITIWFGLIAVGSA